MEKSNDAEDIVEELIRRLEERGAPQGTWLIDIELSRKSLREADDVLRRLKEAIIRSMSISTVYAGAVLELLI